MDKIIIKDIALLGEIARQLRLPVTMLMNGITQEQAEQITTLAINEDNVEVLKSLKNLKTLEIRGIKTSSSRIDLDLSSLKKLENLKVVSTKSIKSIKLDNLSKLWNVNISWNRALEQVAGLEDIDSLMGLFMVKNQSLKQMIDIGKIVHKDDIDTIRLDISMAQMLNRDFPSLISGNSDVNLRNHVQWLEHIGEDWTKMNYDEGIAIERKANEILDSIINEEMSDFEKICAINTWLVENVTYDTGALEERRKVETGELLESDIPYSMRVKNVKANTSYNALVGQHSVCEGYTNAMKYLLNKVGIEAETVMCRIWNAGESKQEYVDVERTNHSIIRFKTPEGWFYSDPTLDSEHPSNRKFFFKTKREMANFHGLVNYEMAIESPEERPPQYSNERLSEVLNAQMKAKEKQTQSTPQQDNEQYQEQPETKTKSNDNPESFRDSLRFRITPEMQEEILRHKQELENVFESKIEEKEEKEQIEDIDENIR